MACCHYLEAELVAIASQILERRIAMFKKLSVFISRKLQREFTQDVDFELWQGTAIQSALKFPTDLARELASGLCEFSESLSHIEYGRLLETNSKENIVLREAFEKASRIETTLYFERQEEIFTITNFFATGKKAKLLVGIRFNFLPDGKGQIRGLTTVI